MKFTIRDLFLVTVIVALAVGWWVDRAKLDGKLRLQEEKLHLQEENLSEQDAEIAGLKVQIWPQVRLTNPPGMKWKLVPITQAPAPNPPKP